MDIKPRPNHAVYIKTLRMMTPEQRLNVAFDLSEFSRNLFRQGLKEQFPNLNDVEFHALYLERLKQCYNNNY